jgi:protein-S-isoprenylcysteine O-methyltransferase Ste14
MTEPIQPPPMSTAAKVANAIILPAGLLALVFWPAGSLRWVPGWVFIAFTVIGFSVSAAWIARVNPIIYRARSRFQPGTQAWDLKLVAVILAAMIVSIPVASFDAGRAHWSNAPLWVVMLGYVLILAGIAGTAWAQGVNPYFEPGVRLQTERHQRVIDTGPYRIVRHPGYSNALMLFAGMPLALGSWWGLVPAGIAGALLVLRTAWEDRLLRASLDGYAAYAGRVRYRLLPGVW